MLEAMRRNLKSLSVSLWIVIASFIFFIFYSWGSGRLSFNQSENSLAVVGKKKITTEDFKYSLLSQLQQISRNYKGRLKRSLIEQLRIPEQVLNQMIQEEIVFQVAKKMGISVTKEEIKHAILNNPLFQKDGRFIGFEEYQRILAYNRISIKEYENSVRKEALMRKFSEIISSGIPISEQEILNEFKKEKETIRMEYAKIDKSKIILENEPSLKEVQECFKINKEKFRIPEKRKGIYVLLNFEDLKKEIDVTEGEQLSYYEDNQEQFQIPEKIRVSRIFLKKDDKHLDLIKDKTNELYERVKKGEDFSSLAKIFSEDEKASSGGDWGYTEWHQLSSEEQRRIMDLPESGVSEVLEIEHGYSILKITEKIPPVTRPFEEVKFQIKEILHYQKAQELGEKRAQEIFKETRKEKSLERVAKRKGIKINWTTYLTKGASLEEIDPSGYISNTLFQIKKGEISEPFFTFNGAVVVELKEIQKERDPSFQEVREKVKIDLMEKLKDDHALTRANSLFTVVRNSESFENDVKKYNFEYYQKDFKRGDYLEGIGTIPSIEERLFVMDKGEVSQPLKYENGYFIVKVSEKKELDKNAFKEEKERIKKTLKELEQKKFYQAYLARIQKELQVKLNYEVYKTSVDEILGRF
ncbi:MAG: SurA N-terminal domain-containing protein [Acidobacteriota bacterium]